MQRMWGGFCGIFLRTLQALRFGASLLSTISLIRCLIVSTQNGEWLLCVCIALYRHQRAHLIGSIDRHQKGFFTAKTVESVV